MSDTKSLNSRISKWVIDHPFFCIIISLLLILSLIPGIHYYREKYDVRVWFRESDPQIKELDGLEKRFGNDENMVIIVHSPSGIFDQESISVIKELTEKMWLVPQIIRVDSLTNYNLIKASGDDINIGPLIPEDIELSDQFLKEREKIALDHDVLPGYLISKDAKTALIFARLVPSINGPPKHHLIVRKSSELLKSFKGRGDHIFHLLGDPVIYDTFKGVSEKDRNILVPILAFLVIVYLIIIFRSIKATLLPFAIILCSIFMTLGLCFYLGMVYNSLLSILPGILLAISIADSIHIIVSFFQFLAQGLDRKTAIFKSLEKNLIPVLLTTISTMIGFFSLATGDLMPIKELGILAGSGTFIAWFLTVFLLAPCLSLIAIPLPKSFKRAVNPNDEVSVFSRKCVSLVKRYQNKIIILFVFLTVGSIYLGVQNEVNSNPYSYFSDETPLIVASEFLKEHIGGRAGPEIIIMSGKEDGIKDPKFLKKVEKLKDWIDSHAFVNKTIDIIDVIKQMNSALHGGDRLFYKIPDDRRQVAEELFLYTMSIPQGMNLNNRMTLKNDDIRMTVLWSVLDTKGYLSNVQLIEDQAKALGLKVITTGKFLLFQRMMSYVVAIFFKSITMALICVSILMMIIFRSVKIGLLSLAPNIIPLALGGAFMRIMDIDLNIGSALVTSVCLGIAVDDTIHFLSHYYQYRKKGLSEEEIIAYIYTYTGKALVMTSVILVTGFGLYVFADFIPNVNFGLLSALVLTSALIIDLVFLPALLFKISSVKLKLKTRLIRTSES